MFQSLPLATRLPHGTPAKFQSAVGTDPGTARILPGQKFGF